VDARTGAAGLRRLGRPDEVFPVVRCEIASACVQRLWDALRDRVRDLPGRCERVTLREDAAGGLHVVAHGGAAWPRAGAVASALAAAGVSATLWVLPDGGRAIVVGGAAPAAGAAAFEQVDAAMGEIVRRHAVAALGPVRGLRAWDLYAGTGATTALLAGAGASVESVECDADAVGDARRRGPADGVTRHAARVEDALPGLGGADVAVVNPPRAGLGPQVADALVARPPGRVAYVSCDPATLARDVARMAPAYRLESVRGFDSFPQTAHVETVAVLARP
jgi:23S rRNA (uracil1939-C5)-methyltransferase